STRSPISRKWVLTASARTQGSALPSSVTPACASESDSRRQLPKRLLDEGNVWDRIISTTDGTNERPIADEVNRLLGDPDLQQKIERRAEQVQRFANRSGSNVCRQRHAHLPR